jgi:hypothetical protein
VSKYLGAKAVHFDLEWLATHNQPTCQKGKQEKKCQEHDKKRGDESMLKLLTMVKLDDSHMTATTPAGILSLLFYSLGFFVSPFGIDLVNLIFLMDTLLVLQSVFFGKIDSNRCLTHI